jgi:hypothetical protein
MLGQRRDTSGYGGDPEIGVYSQCFPQDQRVNPNLVALRGLASPKNGSGDGNRTHTDGPPKPTNCGVS